MAISNSARLARTSDIDDIAAVQIRAWRDAYADLLPAAVLDSLDPEDLAFEWGRAMLAGEQHRVFVAVSEGDGAVVGVASAGPSGDPDLEGARAGEIGALFVDPEHQRRGHGSRLMHACVDMLLGLGMTECVTWMSVADEPRRAFFSSAGWAPDSAYRDLQVDEETTIREVRLITTLS